MQLTVEGPALSSVSETYGKVVDFLYYEASLLDERRHREWLALLAKDVVYRAPVRVTKAHTLADSYLPDMAHFDEDYYSLTKRVERFETGHAWAEDPPSRTRRHLTNIRCWQRTDTQDILARCNLLLFRSRGDVQAPDLVSAQRTDLLRLEEGAFTIARREILFDESVLRTHNLAVFL